VTCSCKELESQYSEDQCKCVKYREHFPDCKCEDESVSDHSPGRVADQEILVRAVFSELKVGSDGEETPASFLADPLNRGLSVDRLKYLNDNSLVSSKRKDSRYEGYLRFTGARCRSVRSLLHNEHRLFCVYDSGTKHNPYHADICQNMYLQPGVENRKLKMKRFRWQLWKTFRELKEFPSELLESQ